MMALAGRQMRAAGTSAPVRSRCAPSVGRSGELDNKQCITATSNACSALIQEVSWLPLLQGQQDGPWSWPAMPRRSSSSCGRLCARPQMRRWRETPPFVSWVRPHGRDCSQIQCSAA